MDTCDICGGALINTGDTDSRQEWITESFCCEDCKVEFTKRTDYHIQTNIPAVIEMTRDKQVSDGRHSVDCITVYKYEYNESGDDKKPQKFEDVFKEMDPQPITEDEIIRLMTSRSLTIEKVIDAVINANGIIGVGLITLGEIMQKYITSKIK